MLSVVFDLDGVLLDSEALHFRAYNEVLARYGVSVDQREYATHWICAGHGPEYAVERYRLPISASDLRSLKAPLYSQFLAREGTLMPGVLAALRRLTPQARLAIATNSGRRDVDFVLDRFQLRSFFAVVVAREDYPRAKPAPDAYSVALQRLQSPGEETLVVEDSPRGVRAAMASGARVVAIANDFTRYCAFPENTPFLRSLDDLTLPWIRDFLATGQTKNGCSMGIRRG